jgi:hypothetical protein
MLKSLLLGFLVASASLLGAPEDAKADDAWKPTPMIRSVEPDTAKAGDVVTLTGEYLDKSQVKDIYLTNGKDDLKLEMVSQTKESAKVKIPASVKAGRVRFMILTAVAPPRFLEMPVAINIE